MARMSTSSLYTRCKLAWNETDQWRALLDDAYSLAAPGRNQFRTNSRTPGESWDYEVFDSTLEHATQRFANRIQAEMFPSFQEWAKFIPGKLVERLPKPVQDEVRARADQATAVIFSTLANSNFAQASHEAIMDIAFGMASVFVLENTKPESGEPLVSFVAVNPAEMAFDSGPHGRVDGVFRKHKMRVHNVRKHWPDVTNLTEEFLAREKVSLENKDEVVLQECMYHCPDSNKWFYDVLLEDTSNSSESAPRRVVERRYNKNRWLTPRWSKNTGETRGRGPVLQALATAMSLNKAKELLLTNASLQIHPVISYIDDGVFNAGNFDLSPGSLTAVGYNNGTRGSTLQPLDLGGDLQLTQFVFEEMQMEIKKIMLDDQLPPEQGAVKSATEWTARMKELNDAKAAPLGRFYNEFTVPLMQVLLDIHQDAGILDKDMKIDGYAYDIQLVSPFAQAQNVNDVNAMAQFVELTAPLGPEVFGPAVKAENIPRYYALKMGLDITEIIRSEEERAQLLQQAAEVQQGQAEQEQQFAMEQKGAGGGGQQQAGPV